MATRAVRTAALRVAEDARIVKATENLGIEIFWLRVLPRGRRRLDAFCVVNPSSTVVDRRQPVVDRATGRGGWHLLHCGIQIFPDGCAGMLRLNRQVTLSPERLDARPSGCCLEETEWCPAKPGGPPRRPSGASTSSSEVPRVRDAHSPDHNLPTTLRDVPNAGPASRVSGKVCP